MGVLYFGLLTADDAVVTEQKESTLSPTLSRGRRAALRGAWIQCATDIRSLDFAIRDRDSGQEPGLPGYTEEEEGDGYIIACGVQAMRLASSCLPSPCLLQFDSGVDMLTSSRTVERSSLVSFSPLRTSDPRTVHARCSVELN